MCCTYGRVGTAELPPVPKLMMLRSGMRGSTFALPLTRRQQNRDREQVKEFNAWQDRLEKKIDRAIELLERRDDGV